MRDLSSLEFPRHAHLPSHFGAWRSRIVSTPEACAAALAEGYTLEPVIVPDGESLDAPADAVASDVAETPETAEPIKRKPGRPKKTEG